MRAIERTSRFKKDFKRELRGAHAELLRRRLREVVERLVADEALPPSSRDHPLRGDYERFRQCHARPDVLLIYELVGDDVVRLVRLGSHSELFD